MVKDIEQKIQCKREELDQKIRAVHAQKQETVRLNVQRKSMEKEFEKIRVNLTNDEESLNSMITEKLESKRHVVEVKPDGDIFIFEYPEENEYINHEDQKINGAVVIIREQNGYEVEIDNGFYQKTTPVSLEFVLLLKEDLRAIDRKFDISAVLPPAQLPFLNLGAE